VELIPAKFEYLFLVGLYAVILASLLEDLVPLLVRDRAFWVSFLVFEATWVLLDHYGPARGLWIFSKEKLCGLAPLGVPIEEHAVFFLMHATAVGTWYKLGANYNELD
jgi:lycopene cyclase domain-containing protein